MFSVSETPIQLSSLSSLAIVCEKEQCLCHNQMQTYHI